MTRGTFDVVMLTTAHAAVDDRIFHREARTLAEAGLSVCVVGQHARSEDMNGVHIEALPKSASRLHRALLGWTTLQRARDLRGKLYIFHDPELFGVGLVLRLLGKKVVYDCHENLPMQVLQKTWLAKPLRWVLVPIVWCFESVLSQLLTGVLVVNETLLKRFPPKRTLVVRNLPPTRVLNTLSQALPINMRHKVVVYAGGLSKIRGIAELVQAFEGLGEDAQLWLVGEFSDSDFREQILSRLPPNVKWFGWMEYSEVLELYKSARIGALLHYPTRNHRNALPVKLFEYLAAGLPVIASDMPEFAELLRGCGVQVNPRDVSQIRFVIQRLLFDDTAMLRMSKIGRERVVTSYCWESDGDRLVDFCSRLASNNLTADYQSLLLTTKRDTK